MKKCPKCGYDSRDEKSKPSIGITDRLVLLFHHYVTLRSVISQIQPGKVEEWQIGHLNRVVFSMFYEILDALKKADGGKGEIYDLCKFDLTEADIERLRAVRHLTFHVQDDSTKFLSRMHKASGETEDAKRIYKNIARLNRQIYQSSIKDEDFRILIKPIEDKMKIEAENERDEIMF